MPKGGTLTQVMYVGIEDEALTKYKERLIGELPASVKRATQLGLSTPRKHPLSIVIKCSSSCGSKKSLIHLSETTRWQHHSRSIEEVRQLRALQGGERVRIEGGEP